MNDHQADCTIYCRRCGREKRVSAEWLRAHLKMRKANTKMTKAEMADDIKRLKCTKCGAKEAVLIWHNKPATIQKPRTARRISSTVPYKQRMSKPIKKAYAKPNKKRTNTGTKAKIVWRKTEQADAVAVRQRNSTMLRKQRDFKQRTAVKYRNKTDIFVIHSDDD